MSETADLEHRFQQRMEAAYWETGQASTAKGKPYWPSRYLAMIRRHGARRAVQRWLARPDAQVGFERTAELGLLHLSIEAIVLTRPWSALFTAEELETARRRLARVGYKPPPDQ
jgi:hypothetical protein